MGEVLLQGYLASGGVYTRMYDEIIIDIPRKTKCIDDEEFYGMKSCMIIGGA